MRISDWSSDVCSSDLWRSVGVEPGINGHLIVVMGIIGRRIGSKAAGWPMFEALIDRQDDHLASTTQTAMHQHARKLALHTGIIALILSRMALTVGRSEECLVGKEFVIRCIYEWAVDL